MGTENILMICLQAGGNRKVRLSVVIVIVRVDTVESRELRI